MRSKIDGHLPGSGITKQAYEEMAAQESKIWGKLWSDPERNEIIKNDQSAAAALNLNRDSLNLKKFLLDNKLQYETGLSLACGEGRAERNFLKNGVCKKFDAIDISQKAIQHAKELAGEQNLPINYTSGDLNFCELGTNKYDLVITQTCLHHVLELEHLANEICQSLRPNGLLWIQDYIGESRFQYSELRVNIVNSVLASLPKELTFNRIRKLHVEQIQRPDPSKIISPFEAIRSEEIMPIFLKKFDVIEKYENFSILHLVCQTGMRQNYVNYKDGQIIFDFLYNLDKQLIEKNILSPTSGQYILRPKSS